MTADELRKTQRSYGQRIYPPRRTIREVLDDAAEKTDGDFVRDVSARITIAVIAEMLGVPRRDWELLFRRTNGIIAPQDPEFQHGATPEETLHQARIELFTYFQRPGHRALRIQPAAAGATAH